MVFLLMQIQGLAYNRPLHSKYVFKERKKKGKLKKGRRNEGKKEGRKEWREGGREIRTMLKRLIAVFLITTYFCHNKADRLFIIPYNLANRLNFFLR